MKHPRLLPNLGFMALLVTGIASGQEPVAVLPKVPPELKVDLFAAEPLIRNPCAMAFDARGRLFVGQGPQYRSPKPETPPDSVLILIDRDGDGIADQTKTFATGFNCIQGLAWRGRDLWVANAPDLTIVRDLNGDDEADEYVLVYTGLGNLEHAVQGLNWAPDGKLYFSKGNSKGLNQPGHVAPKPFRELWGVAGPPGAPDFPPPRTFPKDEYRRSYQDPGDNWGREGGVLRCDDLGSNLEIVARGMRNPWDINFDDGFNWLGTDNDQNEGDRILMPFFGAHFGWSHGWSAHWTGAGHAPTAPVSGPVFPGSGTGVVYYNHPQLPAEYRGAWFINDWLRKTTFLYRPTWDGALMQPAGGKWREFARGRTALFQPVDIEIGPEGALYITGWGASYSAVWQNGEQVNEGRIFRISWPEAPNTTWRSGKRTKPPAEWTFAELAEDLGSVVRVWSVDAQDELVRRGAPVVPELTAWLERGGLEAGQETWGLWALARIAPRDRSIDAWVAEKGRTLSANAALQSLGIAAHRVRAHQESADLPQFVHAATKAAEPRTRFAAVQAIAQARRSSSVEALLALAAEETDRVTYYAAWQALRQIEDRTALRELLGDQRAGVRRAALLALLEADALDRAAVTPLVSDPDASVAGIAALWMAKQSGNSLVMTEPAPGDFSEPLVIKLIAGLKPSAIRWTTDGSEPTPPPQGEEGRESARIRIEDTTTIKAALFVPNGPNRTSGSHRKIGNTLVATWTRREEPPIPAIALEEATKPHSIHTVLPLVAPADELRGQQVFRAAGCTLCHRAGGEGRSVGPDLSAMGDKADARHIIQSLLDPNETITEGFGLQTVQTNDGKSFAGILKEETNRVLTLVQLNGEEVPIEKDVMLTRESSRQSIMPSYAMAMSAQQMADLTAWLLSLGSVASQDTPPSTARQVAGPSFVWEMRDDRCVVTAGGRPVAEFVFKDPGTLRPHWQNIHAPDGTRITRVHPPVSPEATDHAAMHPGLWVGFGDINGQDFWRNKARIEHRRFSEPPTLRDGRLEFTTENDLVDLAGEVIGGLRLRFSLRQEGHAYLISCETVFRAEGRDLVFGDQEEMGFGVRLTAALTEKAGAGAVVNSSGLRGAKEAWGKIADWCDYAALLRGRRVGAAIFAHPANPNPSWWHSRDYGLLVANSFGKKALPPGQGDRLVVERGGQLRLRFAALFYSAPENAPPDLPGLFQGYATKGE